MKQRIKVLNEQCIPAYTTEHSACMDCKANITEAVTLKPGETKAIPLGFCLDLNWGFKAMLYPRSGIALKNNITLMNSPGTCDADFVNEYCAIMHNDGKEDFVINPLDRVCQMSIEHYNRVNFIKVDEMRPKNSKHDGFGSTGTK